jgi:hypothetical protein
VNVHAARVQRMAYCSPGSGIPFIKPGISGQMTTRSSAISSRLVSKGIVVDPRPPSLIGRS